MSYNTTAQTSQQDALPCKTPVSLLQELCMRRGISPKYDLLQIEGAVHEPTFVYRVTVGEFAASGSGQSKKKAKHAAAKAVLDAIIHGPGPNTPNSDGDATISNIMPTSDNVVSPYDDGIPGNPVGQLQEMCMTRRWPPPTYELTSEEGYPHERTFEIACTIATHKALGKGKSKKLAKRQAAHAMMQELNNMDTSGGHDNNAEDDEDLAQKLAQRYSGVKDFKFVCMTGNDARKVSQFHTNLRKKGGQTVKSLQNLSLTCSKINFEKLLREIAAEANFDATYFDIEEISVAGEHQCLVQLGTTPVGVCYGSGDTAEKAKSMASLNALEYLKLMTKPKN